MSTSKMPDYNTLNSIKSKIKAEDEVSRLYDPAFVYRDSPLLPAYLCVPAFVPAFDLM